MAWSPTENAFVLKGGQKRVSLLKYEMSQLEKYGPFIF